MIVPMHTRERNLASSPTWLLRVARVLFPKDPLVELILLRRRILGGARSPDNLRKLTKLRAKVTELAHPE